MAEFVKCKHCKGGGQCKRSGGRSCDHCLTAAGRRPRTFMVVRCAECGGTGQIRVEEVVEEAGQGPESVSPAASDAQEELG